MGSILYSIFMGLFIIGNFVLYLLRKDKCKLAYHQLGAKILAKKITRNSMLGISIVGMIGSIGLVWAIYELAYVDLNKGILLMSINAIFYLLGIFFHYGNLKNKLIEKELYGRIKE